jgi:hypothetical protein
VCGWCCLRRWKQQEIIIDHLNRRLLSMEDELAQQDRMHKEDMAIMKAKNDELESARRLLAIQNWKLQRKVGCVALAVLPLLRCHSFTFRDGWLRCICSFASVVLPSLCCVAFAALPSLHCLCCVAFVALSLIHYTDGLLRCACYPPLITYLCMLTAVHLMSTTH